jgi:amino acid transporter
VTETASRVELVRTIGRWTLTGLILNSIIASGIFGVPSAVVAKLGALAPLGWVVAAAVIGCIVASVAEVASRFTETGGPYLYARVAFGGFVGGLMGWLTYLVRVTSAAANVNLFVLYLAALWPAAERPLVGAAVTFAFFGGLAWLNVCGVRQGARASNLFIVAKLAPLFLLVATGFFAAFTTGPVAPTYRVTPTAWTWLDAGIPLIYAYGGFEAPLVLAGETKRPTRDVPVALAMALLAAVVVYLLVQMVVLWTLPDAPAHQRPLADAAQVLLGPAGGGLVAAGALLSVYGWCTSSMVASPRVTYAMAVQGDLPAVFAWVHPRFRTPVVSIVTYATISFLLAVSANFLKNLSAATISRMLVYGLICLALPVLRRAEAKGAAAPAAFRLPAGPVFAAIGILAALALVTRLTVRDAVILGLMLALAGINWAVSTAARARRTIRPEAS